MERKKTKKVVTIVFVLVIMVIFIAGILVSAQRVPSTLVPYQFAEKRTFPSLPTGVTEVPTTPEGVVTSTTTAKSADEKATATFPAGITISNASVNPFIVKIAPPAVLPDYPPPNVVYVGYAYDFGPTGATFDPAIEIAIEFDPAKFEGKTPVIYTFEADNWVRLDTTILDNKAIAMVTHFSTFVLFAEEAAMFSTGEGTYPSIMGTHKGTIKPSHDVTVNKICTYPCIGTGGHSEWVAFYSSTTGEEIANGTWKGYTEGDYHYITFDKPFTLKTNVIYNYTIETGSYPQIHHTNRLEIDDGVITCALFIDANGRRYDNWIPAIRLE